MIRVMSWGTTCSVVLAVLSGCTATGLTYEQQQAAAFKGCYCAGTRCADMTSATGVAAAAAAERFSARQAEVTRK